MRPRRTSARALAMALAGAMLAAAPVAAQTTPPKTPAKAHAAKPAGPKAIGTFEDWTAATNREAGQTVCYAFTRVQASTPTLSGRGDVVLTVTERPGAGGRDAVAISAGFTYAANAAVSVVVDQQAPLEFYTAQRSAFARDGHAATQAFLKGAKMVASSPAPKAAGPVTDSFSLRGFNAAYAAIVKACPPGGKGST